MRLIVDIKSYWHPGTGRGLGSYLDATTHRNSKKLPSLPGRTVKGLLRDAVYRWEQFGGYDPIPEGIPSITKCLFGPYGQTDRGTWPGLLRFGDAQLADDVVAYFTDEIREEDEKKQKDKENKENERKQLIAGLYRDHFATAIDHTTGTAVDESLRGIELIIPLKLYATVDVVPNAKYANLTDEYSELLKQALPLIQAVGAHRSRGLGRAVLTLE